MEKFDKMVKRGVDESIRFKGLAEQFTKFMQVSTDSDESMELINLVHATGMAIGANSVKRKNLLTGLAIGTLGSFATFAIGKKVKNLRKAKKEQKEIAKALEDALEEQYGFIKNIKIGGDKIIN